MAYQSDSDSDHEALGDIILGGINEHSLRIQSEDLDDLFTGLSSKRRHTRAPNQEHLTFLLQSELHIYTNFHIVPYIKALFASRLNLYIWLAVVLVFRRISDPDDVTERWSSFRLVGHSPYVNSINHIYNHHSHNLFHPTFRNHNWLVTREQVNFFSASSPPPKP